MIIHICGPPGSDEMVIGQKLKDKYGEKIRIIHINDFFNMTMELNKKNIESIYKSHTTGVQSSEPISKILTVSMQELARQYKGKNFVIIGINSFKPLVKVKDKWIQLSYRSFVTLPKCKKLFISQTMVKYLENLAKQREKTNNSTMTEILFWKKFYEKQNYKFLSPDEIIKNVGTVIK